jgi:Rrf2 family protein
MRLEITRRADLAVRAMTVLGAGGRLKAGDLAAVLGSTSGFMPQALGPLVKAGWVRSEPGPTGGYSLQVPLAENTVLDVVEAIDGPTDAGRCVVADRPCGRDEFCALHVAWGRARAELTAALRGMPMSELVAQGSP